MLPPAKNSSWPDALREALEILPPGDPLAQAYHEQREDVRVAVGGEAPEIVVTRLQGLRVRRGGDRPQAIFLADPALEDAAILARRLVAGDGSWSPRNGCGLSAGPTPGAVRMAELLEVTRRAAQRPGVDLVLRWVFFRQTVHLTTPEGTVRADERHGSRVRFEARARREAGPPVIAVGERTFRPECGPEGLDDLAALVVDRARQRLDARPAPSGEHAVVLAPGTGGVLVHELVGHSLEADTVLRGASVLARAPGAIAHRGVNVVDDPRRGRAPWRIDDEGTDTRPISLIERGRVTGRLHDRRTALLAGSRSTGHGRRSSFTEPVRPRMGCTVLRPGSSDPGEILRETSRGIYVRRMESASTDTRSGTAVFRVTDGDLIEDGRLGRPLFPFLLEVQAVSALRQLDRIGRDLAIDTCVGSCVRDGQPLATSVGAPTCRIGVAKVAC